LRKSKWVRVNSSVRGFGSKVGKEKVREGSPKKVTKRRKA